MEYSPRSCLSQVLLIFTISVDIAFLQREIYYDVTDKYDFSHKNKFKERKQYSMPNITDVYN